MTPTRGFFYWRIDRAGVKAGERAGCYRRKYLMLSIDGTLHRGHHLAWLWMTGEWPDRFIDHKNLDKHDNRFSNLRLATKSQNMANCPASKRNQSGLKGVSRYRAGERYGKPWQSGIQHQGKKIHIGHFATKHEAHAAYVARAEKLFGEFARAS
jgi:hypothetical protein